MRGALQREACISSEPSVSKLKAKIITELTDRGMISEIQNPVLGAPGTKLALQLSVPGFSFHSELGVMIDNLRVIGSARRLSDLLEGRTESETLAYLVDADAVARLHETKGYNPILYYAFRDILPPQKKHITISQSESESFWYADLVVYNAGELPNDEPFRSLGHWNPEDQLEIFEVLQGEICMIIAGIDDTGQNFLNFQIYGRGDRCVVPPGGWHVTYVVDGPALVFNIYTEREVSDLEVRERQQSKYRRRDPLEVALLKTADTTLGYALAISSKASAEWKGVSEQVSLQASDFIPNDLSLSDLFLMAGGERLGHLEQEMWTAWNLLGNS